MCAHNSLVNKERFVDDTGITNCCRCIFINCFTPGGTAKREREGPQAQLLTEDVDLKPALEKLRKGDKSEITTIFSNSGHPECPICLVWNYSA